MPPSHNYCFLPGMQSQLPYYLLSYQLIYIILMQAQTDKKKDHNPQTKLNLNLAPDKPALKIQSQQQQHTNIHNSNYPQQLCEPKVMRSSNSNYDSLVQQFYNSQQQASKSYHTKPKNSRDFRTQITYLQHLEKQDQFFAYCIVTKESNSGLISHERFILVSSQYKEVRYYRHIPELPLKSIDDIGQTAKEIIQITKVKTFKVVIGKRGIGQVELSWMDKTESRLWKIKMANNQMARELIALIEDIRTGKYKQLDGTDRNRTYKSKIFGQSRYQQDTSRVNSSIKNSTISPKSKYLQMSSFSTNVRKSQFSSGSKNTQFANLLLKSMHADREPISTPKSHKIQTIKQQTIQMGKEKKVEEGETVVIEPKSYEDNILPVYHLHIDFSEINGDYVEAQTKQQKENTQKQQQTVVREDKEQKKEKLTIIKTITDSKKSLAIERIIKDASIQWIDYQNQRNNDQPNIVFYPTAQRQHHLQNDVIETDQTEKQERKRSISRQPIINDKTKEHNIITSPKSGKPLSKLQQILKDKREQDDTHNKQQPREMSSSKIMVSNLTPKTQKKIEKDIQQPVLHHHRQNLLGERKQMQQSRLTKPATYLNQHSHPRRERSSSPVEYYSNARPNRWLQRWLLAKTQLQLADVYCGFIQKCKQKVAQLTQRFQNWHLFHRQGQSYVVVDDEISLTYTMFREGQPNSYLQQKMAHLLYLWDMVSALKEKEQKGDIKLGVPLACVVVYMGLTVFCKAEITYSELSATLITDSKPYDDLLHTLASVAKIHLRSSQIYSITIKRQVYLYIDEGELKPQIPTTPKASVNEHYINQYVSGIISSDLHLQLIAEHLHSNLSEHIKQQLQNFHPLSCLELEAQLQLLGVEISIIPLLYSQGSLSFFNRIILSQLTAQIMAERVTSGLHRLLLTKNTHKLPAQQIYSLVSSAIRMDSDWVCVQLRKRHVEVNLDVLKQALVEQYVMGSLMVLLGLGCQIKQLPRLQDVQRLDGSFWRQLQINQANLQLTFIMKTISYKAKYFNPHHRELQSHIFRQNQTHQTKAKLPLSTILQYLNTSSDNPYYQSASFKLLSLLQKQRLNNYIAHFNNLQPLPQVPAWQEQQLNPQFHLYHFTSCHYFTHDSFQMICTGIKKLIQRKEYLKAEQLLKEQLVRAWIWAKHSTDTLIEIEDLSSLVFMFAGKEFESLQSCLMALQIGIKAYEAGQIQPTVVLDKAFKAGSIHRNYHRFNRAAELFATAQCVFEEEIIQTKSKSAYTELLQKYLCVYNNRAQLLLTMGSFSAIEEHLHSSLAAYFKMKEHPQHNSDSLSLIFEEQFESYLILFRVYELTAKRVQMIGLMEECSVKFIQNYAEIMQKHHQAFEISHFDLSTRKYLRQILKNIWIGVLSICKQCRFLTHSSLSSTLTQIKRIDFASMRGLIMDLKKARRKGEAMTQEQAIVYLFQLIASHIQKNQANVHFVLKDTSKSILVSKIIDCFSAISEAYRGPDTAAFNQLFRSQKWTLLEIFLSVVNQDWAVGAIELHLQSQYTQV